MSNDYEWSRHSLRRWAQRFPDHDPHASLERAGTRVPKQMRHHVKLTFANRMRACLYDKVSDAVFVIGRNGVVVTVLSAAWRRERQAIKDRSGRVPAFRKRRSKTGRPKATRKP